MKIFDDTITGLILATGLCCALLGLYRSDSIMGTIGMVIQASCLGLFVFRIIRIWGGRAYNPPAHIIPVLKLIYAVLCFIIATEFWHRINGKDNLVDIGLTIFIVTISARQLYTAIRLIVRNRTQNTIHKEDI